MVPRRPEAATWAVRSRCWRTQAPRNGPAAMPRNVAPPTTPSALARAGPSNRRLAPNVASGTIAPGAQALDQARPDEDGQGRGGAGDQRGKGEQAERQRQGRHEPVAVGRAPGDGHDGDARDEEAIDDPRRLAQFLPARQVLHDRGQRRGRHQQLGAGQPGGDAQDAHQRPGGATTHGRALTAGSVRGGTCCSAGRHPLTPPRTRPSINLSLSIDPGAHPP